MNTDNPYPTIWDINLASRDWGKTLFRCTVDGEMVYLSFEELKRRLLSPSSHDCLTCLSRALRHTALLVRMSARKPPDA